ncbi:MAG TPA: hypothetical protein VMV18_09720, partial [bacterium]|nr:hypothetical protein [bacterium]
MGTSGAFTLAYDANGAETGDSLGNSFAYNVDGRVSAAGDSGAPINPSASMSYDGFGLARTQKTWTSPSGAAEDLRYFGLYEELRDGATLSTDRYIMVGGQRVAWVTSRAPGETFFLQGDLLGSIALITDHTGAMKERREYAPFGSPTV